MFSNSRFISSIFILVMFMLSISCTPKLGEKPPNVESQQLNNVQCMSEASLAFKDFVLGTAAPDKLSNGWDCITLAFDKFQKYVRGQNKEYYTSQELADFIEQNFFEQDLKTKRAKNPISPSLQAEFMKFKQIFVGGSRQNVTRDEILKSIELFRNFKRLTLRINPYMKVLTLNWKPSSFDSPEDTAYFEQVNTEIQYFAREIASQIQKNEQKYELDDFAVFMREMAKFYNEEWEVNNKIEQFMPVAKKLKKAIAGGSEDEVSPDEWKSFILLGARGYVQYLRYFYFIKSAPNTGSAIRLAYLARSTEDAFSTFQDLVSIKPGGVIGRSEFRDVLFAFSKAWPDFKISDGFIFELMKIKKLLVGGAVDSLTSSDFEHAKLKVSRLKELVERFLPYYDLYGLEWDHRDMTYDQGIRYFGNAQTSLVLTASELGSLLESTYDLNDIVGFIHELELLYPPDPGQSWEISISKYLPLIKDTKKIVYGDDSIVKQGQWASLLGLGSRAYTEFLFFSYFLKDQDFAKKENLLSLTQFSNQSLDLLRDVLAQKNEHIISLVELNLITARLKEVGVVPQSLKPQSIEELIKAIVNYILLSPEKRITDKLVPNGVDLNTVETFRKEFQIWAETELFIVETYSSTNQAALLPQDLRNAIAEKLKSHNITDNLKEGLNEYQMEVSSPVPLDVDTDSRLRISNRVGHFYSLMSARYLNLSRLMARVLIRSFTNDLYRIRTYSGITLEEARAGFSKISPIFVDLKFLDSSGSTFIDNRFREANIFMPRSDGNEYASFFEASEIVNMIFSGVIIDSMLRPDLVAQCLPNIPSPTNETLIPVACVRSNYKKQMPKIFASMPEYVRFVTKVNNDEFTTAFNNSIKAAGYVPNDKGLARLGDVSLFPHLIQYSEMLMARFDTDMDGGIGTQEAIRAFPSFQALFKLLAKEQLEDGTIKEKDLLALFTYVLHYGHAPSGIMEGLFKWYPWKAKKPSEWNVWADRSQVAKILGYIADQMSKKTKNDIKDALDAAHREHPEENP